MMDRDDEKIKRLIASNISYYRKQIGLTQAELAGRIFYSDKSISKWERAEGMPDICVLVALAELFGVTLNDMVSERHKKRRRAAHKLRHGLVTLMADALVWLAATLIFFVLRVATPQFELAWYAFVIAAPVTFVVTTVLTTLWYPLLARFLSVSALIWSIAMALDVCIRMDNMYLIYTVAAILQVLAGLWYLFIAAPKLAVRIKRHKPISGASTESIPVESDSLSVPKEQQNDLADCVADADKKD